MRYIKCPIGTILQWENTTEVLDYNRYRVIKGGRLQAVWDEDKIFDGYPESKLVEYLNEGTCQIYNEILEYEIY